jgi:hypothetical protein
MEAVLSILDTKYPTGQVAHAAEIDSATLQNWFRRGHVRGDMKDDQMIEGGGVQGRPRVFSWAAMMEVSIAARLIEAGCSPGRAFEVAQLYSDTGDGEAGFVGVSAEDPLRKPGLPFHHGHGETILVLRGEEAEILLAKDGLVDLSMYRHSAGKVQAVVALNVSQLFQIVALRLGVDGREILDKAYPGAR